MRRSDQQSVQLTVSLSQEDLDFVRTLVTTGAFKSDSDVVREGLGILRGRQQTVDKWLRDDVIPAFHRLKEDPATGMSVDDLRAALAVAPKSKG